MKTNKTTRNIALTTAAIALGAASFAHAAPFAADELARGYMLAQVDTSAMKAQKKHDAKGGKVAETGCGADKRSEGSCGADKKADGSCGDHGKAGATKKAEGKCGEAKCGGR